MSLGVCPLATQYTPDQICYSSQNNYVYVAMPNAGEVAVIDCATNSILATVTVGAGPSAPCYNPTSNKVFCTGINSRVTMIDGATDSVITTVDVAN